MPVEHTHLTYDSIPYDEVSELLPLSSLPNEAVECDTAALETLYSVPTQNVLAVAPVSMATGYKLAQMPLTVVRLDRLTGLELGAVNGVELLVFGRPHERQNHSLTEYA